MQDTVSLPAVQAALAHTHIDTPREPIRIDLPLGIDRVLGPAWDKHLRSAAVLVPIIDRPDGATVLLTQRSDSLKDHAGQISFPGGSVEPQDTNVVAAALREAQEEIGLSPDHVQPIGLLGNYPTVTRFCITPVVARVDPAAHYAPDEVEVSAVFELPLDLALDTGAYARKSIGRLGLQIPYYELMYEGWRIWGATAGMLYALAETVQNHAG